MRRLAIVAALLSACAPVPAFAGACDGGELVLVDLPDGGPPLPQVLCAGDVAPVDLVVMVPRRAAETAGKCTAAEQEAKTLEAAIKSAPPSSATWVVVGSGTALVLGLVLGFVFGKR